MVYNIFPTICAFLNISYIKLYDIFEFRIFIQSIVEVYLYLYYARNHDRHRNKKYWEYYWIVFQWRKYNEAYTALFTICYLHPKASYNNVSRTKSLLVLDTEENFKCFRQTLECAQRLSFNYILIFLILLPYGYYPNTQNNVISFERV